ncbi:MAG: phenylacetate-CoA oxygenase subunit PaaJ [Gammaproteobacteria bacterium]|nr:phenylacetate-CoA oxygenase subunit PaaJ [Gammaproteobacteria bacterium]
MNTTIQQTQPSERQHTRLADSSSTQPTSAAGQRPALATRLGGEQGTLSDNVASDRSALASMSSEQDALVDGGGISQPQSPCLAHGHQALPREQQRLPGERVHGQSVHNEHVRAILTPGSELSAPGASALNSAQDIRAALDKICDPELPGITIDEMGILRDVDIAADTVTVWITPTWSGCPALDEINDSIRATLAGCGRTVHVRQRLSPAWSSRWLSDSARQKLEQMNIAPPVHLSGRDDGLSPVRAHRIVKCPRCSRLGTRLTAECGSTACKAFYSCPSCDNTFEYFKDI